MKKIFYVLLAFSFILGSCKKDKKTTDVSQQNVTKKNLTTKQEKVTASTVDDVIKLIKDKKFDGLITSDSIFVLNNKMSMQHIENYSKKDAIKQLDVINTSLPVFKDEEPSFDGEVFDKNGFFVHDKKYKIIGDWTGANPEVKQKASDLDKKITKVVEYVKGNTDLKIYLSKDNNSFKIAMIDISTPGEI